MKWESDLLSTGLARDLLALLIPVHFATTVPEGQIRHLLGHLLEGLELFCRTEHVLAVVDRGTVAERVLREFPGLRVHSLERNRGKAGAVASGLAQLVETSDARFFATRDCDGDHAQEDLPRLVSLAAYIEQATTSPLVVAMGARPSLEKPMGWLRDQWERLTNAVLVDLLDYVLAREGRVLDRRFWSGSPTPDIQSGFRVYSRPAAERVRDVLASLPEDPNVWTFACEFVPFADLIAAGGVTGEVRRFTLVEQPVSSYRSVDLGRVYARLLQHLATTYEVPASVVRQFFDNRLVGTSLFFTDSRKELLEARRLIDAEAPSVLAAPFL